ncbi:hypothetical protein Oscil6304_5715 [Oscillatoria acuminata PCC 6304]|uniref:Uncharacterized protein n=1 Tax=Oscillatoria acuminata PCC 6304 TaxID=56110 RepID=K9TRK3_9CYAN|nr:hypothetical protein Oscil6304_5715 [Oscillatoria acuminata PCC 6304]
MEGASIAPLQDQRYAMEGASIAPLQDQRYAMEGASIAPLQDQRFFVMQWRALIGLGYTDKASPARAHQEKLLLTTGLGIKTLFLLFSLHRQASSV